MDNLSFCAGCGAWVPPTMGVIQLDEGGKVVIFCGDCFNLLPQSSSQSPNAGQQVCEAGSEVRTVAANVPGEQALV